MSAIGPTDHSALAAGLRELADWFEQHPEVPAPWYPTFHMSIDEATGRKTVESIELIAEALGGTEVAYGVHVRTEHSFGPVRFYAVHVPDEAMQAHEARISYAGNVVVDGPGGAA